MEHHNTFLEYILYAEKCKVGKLTESVYHRQWYIHNMDNA